MRPQPKHHPVAGSSEHTPTHGECRLDCCAGLKSLLGRICIWLAQLCGSFVIAELAEHAKRHVADGFQHRVPHSGSRIVDDAKCSRAIWKNIPLPGGNRKWQNSLLRGGVSPSRCHLARSIIQPRRRAGAFFLFWMTGLKRARGTETAPVTSLNTRNGPMIFCLR